MVESQPSKLLVAGSIPVSRSIFYLQSEPRPHHCAIGIGHIATKIEKLGALLNIETVRIC